MLKNFIAITVVIFLFAGCKNSAEVKFTPTRYNNKLTASISYDSVSTAVKGPQLKHFYRTAAFFPKKDSLFYVGYNEDIHTLDIFQVYPATNFIKHVKLEQLTSDEYFSIKGLYVHNLDSIFIFDERKSKISLIDQYGKTKNRYNLNNRYNDFFSRYTLHVVSPTGQFLYDKTKDRLIVRISFLAKNSQSKYSYENNVFDAPLAAIDLATNKISLLEFPIPEAYSTAYYSGLIHPQYYWLGPEKLIGSYPISANIYTYDLAKKQGEVYEARSAHLPTLLPPFNENDINNGDKLLFYSTYSANYLSMVSDTLNKFTFRLQLNQADTAQKNIFKAMLKRKLFLSILDDQFAIIKELEIDRRGVTPFGLTTFKNKLVMPVVTTDTSKLTFRAINYKIEKK